MLRSGVTPVPVATKIAGVSSVGARVKRPWGPRARSVDPTGMVWRYSDPGPPLTRVTAISKRPEPEGAEAIE